MTGLLAVDRLFLAYIGITGLFALVVGGETGVILFLLHLAAAAAVVGWSRRPLPRSPLGRILRLGYAVLLTPLLYAELAILNQFLEQGFFDTTVQAWELALFSIQPSLEASRRLPSFFLSELLHLGYFSYYLLVPAALLGAWATRGDPALHRIAFATALAFYISYLCFVTFPVTGPRYLFPPPEGPPAEGGFYGVVHALLEVASSKGTAFPSSHVAGAGAAVLAAGLEDRRWLWLLLPPWALLALGTVYGGFHYGVDALAGVAVAALAVTVTYGLVSAASSDSGATGIRISERLRPPAGAPEPEADPAPGEKRGPRRRRPHTATSEGGGRSRVP